MPYPEPMARPEDDPGQEFRDAHTALTSAYGAAVSAIDAHPDPQAAFTAASDLAATLREIADDAAKVRARGAVRIRDKEKLSLAQLAQRISVSRARADQMIKAAKTTEEDPCPSP